MLKEEYFQNQVGYCNLDRKTLLVTKVGGVEVLKLGNCLKILLETLD